MYQSYGPRQPLDAIRNFFKRPAILPRLILINLAVFLLVYFTNLVVWLFQIESPNDISFITYWLSVPASLPALVSRPWSLISYMFLHEGFFHLLFNMWILYFGGIIFLRYLNERQMLTTYLLGGLAGALMYILAYNIFPVFISIAPQAIALGASASVLAILIAIATYVPGYVVNLFLLGPVRLKYIAIVLVVIDFFSIQGSNPGGHIAHLGGALYGFLFALSLKKQISLPKIRMPKWRKKKLKTTYRNPANFNERPLSDEEYNRRKVVEQQEIDEILDKVSKSGYDSLTAREKKILFGQSSKS